MQLQEFEDRYVTPYIKKQEDLSFEGKSDEKINNHVKFLTSFLCNIKAVVESKSIDRVLVSELKEKLKESGVLKPTGELKISLKEQMTEALQIIHEIITIEKDENT